MSMAVYENNIVTLVKSLTITGLANKLLEPKNLLLNDIFHVYKDVIFVSIIQNKYKIDIRDKKDIQKEFIKIHNDNNIDVLKMYPVLFYSIRTFKYRHALNKINYLKTLSVEDRNTEITKYKEFKDIFKANRDTILRAPPPQPTSSIGYKPFAGETFSSAAVEPSKNKRKRSSISSIPSPNKRKKTSISSFSSQEDYSNDGDVIKNKEIDYNRYDEIEFI